MLKKFLAVASLLFAAMSYAAVDVNKATLADLDSINGIGPGTAATILAERKKSDFKDWADFQTRVKGVKDKRAAKLSEGGLTVGGASYAAASAATINGSKK
jgi:competence protein ComEA